MNHIRIFSIAFCFVFLFSACDTPVYVEEDDVTQPVVETETEPEIESDVEPVELEPEPEPS